MSCGADRKAVAEKLWADFERARLPTRYMSLGNDVRRGLRG